MYSTAASASVPSLAASISPVSVTQSKLSDSTTATSRQEQGTTLPMRQAVGSSSESQRPAPDVTTSGLSTRLVAMQGHGQAAAAATADSAPQRSSEAAADSRALNNTGVQCGVGVYLKLAQEGFVEVKATEPGCSADGMLFVGDIVTAVEGNSCVGLSVRDITRLIVGEEGTCVTISVMRELAVSPASTKTVMREIPVVLTRRPLPQQRSARAVKELSDSRSQTPRGDIYRQTTTSLSETGGAQTIQLSSVAMPNALSPLEVSEASSHMISVQNPKDDAPMRQFFVSNVGSLPLKLTVFDCDDVLRVSELVLPLSQYPREQNTCAITSSAKFAHCFA
jgi:hypothetical protein